MKEKHTEGEISSENKINHFEMKINFDEVVTYDLVVIVCQSPAFHVDTNWHKPQEKYEPIQTTFTGYLIYADDKIHVVAGSIHQGGGAAAVRHEAVIPNSTIISKSRLQLSDEEVRFPKKVKSDMYVHWNWEGDGKTESPQPENDTP